MKYLITWLSLFFCCSVWASDASSEHSMADMPASWTAPATIVMVAYPGFTALDLAGPQYAFASMMGAKVLVVAESLDPVKSDTGLSIVPDVTFDNAPEQVDVLFVPGGGLGTTQAIANKKLIAFVKSRGQKAKYVTSVCTGSLVLGAAGLLDGYKATSHWLTLDSLPQFGAIKTPDRVVIDRNRVTGAGVTSGIDFSLTLVGLMRDDLYAQTVQLLAEYDPKPPYNAGSPQTAPEMSVMMLKDMFKGYAEKVTSAYRSLQSKP